MTSTIIPSQLREELAHFCGTEKYTRHWGNRRTLLSDGVVHLAERAEAFWLIDLIAFHLASLKMDELIAEDPRLESLQFWKLTVREDGSASLTMNADLDEPLAIDQQVPATDFPLETIDIWAAPSDGHWVLYLPSEH